MIRRVSHLSLALIAVAAMLAPAALASGSGKPTKHKRLSNCVSAVCVYVEPNQTASGTSFGGFGTGKSSPLTAYALSQLAKYGGTNRRVLQTIGEIGFPQPKTGKLGNVSPPNGLLAAFDLGPGPIALFVTLLAGATAFGVGGALRRRRRLG